MSVWVVPWHSSIQRDSTKEYFYFHRVSTNVVREPAVPKSASLSQRSHFGSRKKNDKVWNGNFSSTDIISIAVEKTTDTVDKEIFDWHGSETRTRMLNITGKWLFVDKRNVTP